ncbi:MAG: YbjN domain-containing protein [Oscillatoria sp. PMC 1051.18]|uniref:YbjN domain-containing protein n=1 Tax=Oscillatoria salina TaxID=331517 RepID=UPI0013BD7D1A|nr:YbjN domain-containing protein [Oscillatoria salina]MBZ8181963.1 YbjN domain-containing protein [Oscillatoria salina IIICB1]MEC4893761.1 YbjN domain-containing protein [Oscillatoria sp. PMC 1050.18]MEC5030469.1 YbjN domain-containing protein [Oscillatoria sp. PMC 1051.18]NET89339.1 YbjN domain-containing protein [Kamptonema sp. SIO1D9]
MTTQNQNPETAINENDLAEEAIASELVEEATSHEDVIETVISSLDMEDTAMVNHSEDGILWKFNYGSVEVFVQLTGESDEDLFTVWATVLPLPAKNEPKLMRRLLEMNWEGTFETCFGIFNDRVVVLSQRTVAELSPGEISRAITLVATIADDNDEAFQEEFGAD